LLNIKTICKFPSFSITYLLRRKRIKKKKLRINDKINSREVRLINSDGGQLGVVDINNAIEMAQNEGLDLVEIAPDVSPPVCKIMDYGKYRYEQQKKIKLNKKNQTITHVKELRIRPNTGEHDLITKLNKGQKFLENGDKLKITVMFRGREMGRQERGFDLINKVIDILKDIAKIDKEVAMEGRKVSVVLCRK